MRGVGKGFWGVNTCRCGSLFSNLSLFCRVWWPAFLTWEPFHGCHRHQFSKFPDISLIKVKFPWPNKCKISVMVAASNLRSQQSFAPIRPEMFLPSFDGIKSVLQYSRTPIKRPPIKRPPLIKRLVIKVPKSFSVKYYHIYPCISRPFTS